MTAFGSRPAAGEARIPDLRSNNPGLVFLDTAASAQKPRRGDRRRRRFLPHRLRQRASRRLSAERALDRRVRGGAREGARAFSTPPMSSEIVFVRGATEAINLVAQSWGAAFLKAGDEISSPISSITPISCRGSCCAIASAARCVVAPIDATGGLDLAQSRGDAHAADQAWSR